MKKMSASQKIDQQLDKIAQEIGTLGPFMRGSVTIMGKRHKQPYFSVGIGGKTHLIYLGDERAVHAQKCVDNYKKLMKLIEQMTLLQMQKLQAMPTTGVGNSHDADKS